MEHGFHTEINLLCIAISIIQLNYPNNSTFNVETALRSLLLHLPQLVSLDISGTNLAGKDTTVKFQ
jgi:hypothetical protein